MLNKGATHRDAKAAENLSKSSSRLRRLAECIPVKPDIIFPRVHVARNERRVDRQPPHLIPMSVEERAQALLRIEMQQVMSVFEIDQDGMSPAPIEFRLDELS